MQMKRMNVLCASGRLRHRRGSVPIEPTLLPPTYIRRKYVVPKSSKYASTQPAGNAPGSEEGIRYDDLVPTC
jgi:hypothetical protein